MYFVFKLLGRRLADPTVLETLGVNFRRAAGYPHAKRQIFVTKVEAICVIFGRFPPKFWEILLSGLPRILCKWGKSMAFMNNKYSII